ncbi:hypothetical protein [Spiroplasma endosymbiont of Nebria brevicollis]
MAKNNKNMTTDDLITRIVKVSFLNEKEITILYFERREKHAMV